MLIGVLVMLSILTVVCIVLAVVLALLYRQVQATASTSRSASVSINSIHPSVPLAQNIAETEYSEKSPLLPTTAPEKEGRFGPGWEKVWDNEEQRFYYHNKATGESKWDD